MSKRSQRLLILIIIIIGFAIYIDLPNTPGIHIGGFNKDFETRLGLDLVGGVQALLEADVPPETSIDANAMKAATRIVESRVNGLGVNEAVVQQAGDRRIVVELPGETDPERALETLQQTGLLEFVDFSGLTDAEIFGLETEIATIKTDFGLDQNTVETATVSSTETVTATTPISPTFHTVMTGAELKNVFVLAFL